MTPTIAIRFAMLAGVLLFGGVAWFSHRDPGFTAAAGPVLDSLSTVGMGLWVVATLGFVILFWRSRSPQTAAQASTTGIIAWSIGEGLALFGGVFYLQSGVATWYIGGVIALALSMLVFPGRAST